MRRYIKGEIQFKELKSEGVTGSKTVASLADLAKQIRCDIDIYSDSDTGLLCFDYKVAGITKAECKKQVSALKAEARKHGRIKILKEKSGYSIRIKNTL